MRKDYHKITFRTRQAGILLLLMLAGAGMLTGCKKKTEKIDLTSIHTTAAETMAPETTKAPEPETTPAETAAPSASVNKNLTTAMNTYTSGKVTIQYPSVSNLDDAEKAAKIDDLLKTNALSIIDAYGINEAEDTLSVECSVLSADRSRITVTYTGQLQAKGAASPTAMFFSNTIDTAKVENLGFSKFADPYTMAGYVLSDDCQFANASADRQAALKKAKNDMTIDQYTRLFNEADFPLKSSAGKDTFRCFSYEQDGTIFFSIPVSHELGDYAIVMYTPDTK